VEAPVLSMVATLLPGVSTLTQFARYYALYWAIADLAERDQLDAAACRQLIRRAEVLFAFASRLDVADPAVKAHGADALERGISAGKSLWQLAEEGKGSYSPRAWGFWSQYGGPSDVLGTATSDAGTLRGGRHGCPPDVRELYAPLLAAAAGGDVRTDDVLDVLSPLALGHDTPDLTALCDLFTATRSGRHKPGEWVPTDRIRRSSLRIVARATTLAPSAVGPLEALRRAVAFGQAATDDDVLAAEGERTVAWRGLLLRHYSVGAWRRLWAELVAHVKGSVVTREGLHGWICDRLPVLRSGSEWGASRNSY
jgi:hypothetical protein